MLIFEFFECKSCGLETRRKRLAQVYCSESCRNHAVQYCKRRKGSKSVDSKRVGSPKRVRGWAANLNWKLGSKDHPGASCLSFRGPAMVLRFPSDESLRLGLVETARRLAFAADNHGAADTLPIPHNSSIPIIEPIAAKRKSNGG